MKIFSSLQQQTKLKNIQFHNRTHICTHVSVVGSVHIRVVMPQIRLLRLVYFREYLLLNVFVLCPMFAAPLKEIPKVWVWLTNRPGPFRPIHSFRKVNRC